MTRIIINSKIKIVFFGTPEFAVPSLHALKSAGLEILAVITAPDKPAGRQKILQPSPVKLAALGHGLTVFEPATLADENFFAQFRSLAPDAAVVAAYGKIIPQKYLDIPRLGFVNVHPSFLPKYRGPSPVQSALLAGEKEIGISIILMDSEVDHGPLLAVKKIRIADTISDARELKEKLAIEGARLLADTLIQYANGMIQPREQDHSQATYTKKLSWDDGHIDWSKTADEITNFVRAFNPEPGAWSRWNRKIVRIIRLHALPFCASNSELFGRISILNGETVVRTGTCHIVIDRIQLEGSREMNTKDFINGHPSFLDSLLE